MIIEQNTQLPGVAFTNGVDVTADMLTGLQQFISTEMAQRSKDFNKYPGVAWGFKIASVIGKSILVTEGVAFDQNGTRLEHPTPLSYAVDFPTTGVTSAYFCVKSKPVNTLYKLHPYNGTRHATETLIGLTFFIDTTLYTDPLGNIYPSDNDGLVLGRLTIKGSTYDWSDVVTSRERSPYIKMQDGN